ncbi:hypothetical protein ACM66B_006591 [Microbotryomycetes sp. NB124-2]
MSHLPPWHSSGQPMAASACRSPANVTQHPPSTDEQPPFGLPTPSRSLFVPIRKHGSSSTCGSTASLSPPTSPRASTNVRTNLLTPSTAHNVLAQQQHHTQTSIVSAAPPPKFNLLSPTPNPVGATGRQPPQAAPRIITAKKSTPSLRVAAQPSQENLQQPIQGTGPSTFVCSSSPLSTAPKIRAKVTAVATPRRKPALVGTDNVAFTASSHGAARVNGLDGAKRWSAATSGNPLSSQPSKQFGSFDSNHTVPVSSSDLTPATPLRRVQPVDMSRLVTEQAALTGMATGARMYRSAKGKDNVLVCVRVRPPAAKLVSGAVVDEQVWNTDETTGRVQLKTGTQEFMFDSVVTGSDNASVYEEAGKDLVLAAMEGFDSVIFAYGQTASGKTFTLTGNVGNPGIIPQSVTEIFAYIREHPEQEFLLRASYLEIYNETLKDLLAPETGALRIRQDDKKRFFVSPLREEVVTHEAQVAALLRRGEANRSVGATDFNETSSRSHSLFQMTIESRARDDVIGAGAADGRAAAPGTPRLATDCGGPVRMSRLSLIDLAGSEQATSQAERRSEGAFINKSLLTLEKVIASLTEDSKRKPHVPYRDSKLTQILQPSLSGDARVAVIATINPSPSAVEESKSTLKFATRVKKVQLKAVVNEVIDDKALITKYRAEIVRLQVALQAAQSGSAPGTPTTAAMHGAETTSQMQEMQNQLTDLRSLIVTSRDVGDRRRSMQPSRPVSPLKPGRRSQHRGPETVSEEDEEDMTSSGASTSERLDEANDEIEYLKSENSDLKRRISELEQEKLQHLSDFANESSKDARIAQLVKENQEMLVVIKNQDNDAEMKRMEMRFKREIEKRVETERRLRDEVEFERNRIKKMEKFIIDRIQTSYDLIMGKVPPQQAVEVSSSSCSPPTESLTMPGLPNSTSTMSFGGLVGGFLPIISERSPDVASSSTLTLAHKRNGGRRSSTFDHDFDTTLMPVDASLKNGGLMYDDSDGEDDNVVEDAEFGKFEFLSKETRDTLKKSGSVMLLSSRSR